MAAKKVSFKDAPRPSQLAGGENQDGVPAEGEEVKPPPTFEEMWFDDPVEGREAQRLALELRKNVVLRAEPMRIYLERTGIVAMLLQGLQHLAKARPIDPNEWLAAFLLKNNPRKDMIILPPKIPNPDGESEEAPVEPVEPVAPVDPKKKKIIP